MLLAKVRTLRALPPADRACLWRALRLLPVVGLSLKLRGTRKTQAWLGREDVPAQQNVGRLWPVVRMVRVAQRYHRPWSNCLSHALTLWALLQREGIATEVRVGTRLHAGRLEAHAWVEWQGRALTEPGDGAGVFTAFHRPLVGRTP